MNKVQFDLTKWYQFLALGFGSGLSPKAPGTMGTIAAIPLVVLLLWAGNIYLLTFVVLGSALGVYLCGQTARDIGEHDHGAIVWDEIIGLGITMLWAPLHWQTLLVGFVLFRLFDIVKPWPISVLDRSVHGGIGIMLDDIAAGLAALASLQLLIPFLPLG
ncbi:phosphatidylglycerophosphatase A family protein [Rheinheimera baltica]|uniref:Phosphatidylglycerophosphatase A n=1 Tax=Rheinheimera baltica TaxID=67576 RepID=A0ABT9HU33_9GAMM|nr:phosphatidylglycerophosphatase A [Rheinheimera baltica]MDP5134508.1 phosphatidylglycerophosphatase A [Rheinheimera baltica]MDP5141333.1 phosphatidylglycerophosphatase A [Rheinheimera baltica]MDP5148562.1 phosphatidylglycerophosphatase A [Rheinheimera baltica]MDP5188782.1 phosphatidylglycerophosphatase A [Rheinheimera baltica]